MPRTPLRSQRFKSTPQCPICRFDLLPVTTEFVEGIAFCTACADSAEPQWVLDVMTSRSDRRFAGCWELNRGLLYFTPQSNLPSDEAVPMLMKTLYPKPCENVPPESEA